MRAAILALLLLASCSTAPGCFVGVSLVPPGPIIVCGYDASPADPEDDLDV